jgi:hypothetical protein
METLQKRQKIYDVLNEIEEELAKHPDTIPEHVFQTLETICKLVYLWKTSEKKTGWSKQLGLLEPEESTILESRFQDFDSQSGGGEKEDEEFENEYKTFQQKLGDIGIQWREIMNALGVVATNTLQRVTASLGEGGDQQKQGESNEKESGETKLTGNILMFFSTLVESLRIWVAYSYVDSATYRVLLSFSQGILDTIRGNIRQALISSLGVFGQHGYYISVLMRFVVNIIETVSPGISKNLEMDLYKNMKTITAGALLWTYYTFAPLSLKYQINQIFEEVKKIAKEEEIAMGPLTSKLKKAAADKDIEVPNLPLDTVPSYEDIQILGSLLNQPDIACLPSFKKLMYPLRSIFMLRLTLDLLNVPTGKAEIDDLCARQKNTTRKNSQKGGKKKTRKVTAS